MKIRVRIAPSPTGLLHIGTARAALFNYLFAKKNKGKFILRIEDTDLERSDAKYEKNIIEGLKWLGLKWDEKTYRQSERTKIYEKYIRQLFDKKLAYFCPCAEEQLKKEKQEQITQKKPLVHLCPYREKGIKKGIIRFKTPADKKIKFIDLIRGELEFDTSQIGDFSIAKAIDIPLYNFAVVIDDCEMKISHVIRGEDHISNTPKQILLQESLSLPTPQYAHLPLILGPDKSKLSKRHAAVSINEYYEQGYLPEAMVNFMVLLGWNPGTEEEIFALKNLEKIFSLDRVGKSGAIFNIERLNWLNGYYVRQMKIKDLTEKCSPYLENLYGRGLLKKIGKMKIQKIVALEQKRIKTLSEIGEITKYFFAEKLDYDPEILRWKNITNGEIKESLQKLYDIIKMAAEKRFDAKTLKKVLIPEAEVIGDRGSLLWPLRAALTGLKASPDPFSIMEILGKERTLKRIKEACEKIF